MFTYTVDPDTFVVHIYANDHTSPFLHQPDWPNKTPWSSAEEASGWAVLCIASIEDPAAPYAPAGPGLPGEPKIVPQ